MIEKIKPKYDGIVDIARHCDMSKLEIAQNNAISYDLDSIICKFGKELNEADDGDPIFIGGTFDLFNFGGVNKIVGLFSYARYVEGGLYVDTGSGLVRKQHENSIPFQTSEVADLASQHRRMANVEVERLEAYICSLKQGKCLCGHKICCKNDANYTYRTHTTGFNIKRKNHYLDR